MTTNQQRPKFLVYYCGKEGSCGGYGNRLFALASLFYLAVLTNRAFVIHWDYPRPLDTYLVPNEIKWNYSLNYLTKLEHRHHWWSNYQKRAQQKKGWLVRDEKQSIGDFFAVTNFSSYFNKAVEIVALMWDTTTFMHKNPYLRKQILRSNMTPFRLSDGKERRFNLLGCAFDFLFKKAQRLETMLMSRMREILKPGDLTIGLHIRTGDEAFGRRANTSWFLKPTALANFFACAQKVENWLKNGTGKQFNSRCKIKWFLATDNISVKAYARKHFPLKSLTLDVNPSHIGIESGKKILENDGMTTVLLDHFLLSKCDFLVLSQGSTFGETAAGLGMRGKRYVTYGGNCELLGTN